MDLGCMYPERNQGQVNKQLTTMPKPRESPETLDCVVNDLAVTSAACRLADLFATPVGNLSNQSSMRDFRALQHFHTITCATFGNSIMSRTMQRVVAQSGLGNSFLMHMALALSGAHQRHLHHLKDAANETTGVDEAHHWQRGLQLYQAEILRLIKLSPAEKCYTDDLIAATFLTVIYTFALGDGLPSIHDLAGEEYKFAPVAATRGFQALRIHLGGLQDHSSWLPAITATGDYLHQSDATKLPRAFAFLCGLNDSSTSETSPYYDLVLHLGLLLRLKWSPDNMSNLFSFSGRLWARLDPLVKVRDSRALLILSWWFALLRQIDQWWVKEKAMQACMAIVHRLSTSQEPLVQRLLEYPASFGEADCTWIWDYER